MSIGRDLKGDLKQDGYSQEEKYFYELNRKLIQSIREKNAAETDSSVRRPGSAKTPSESNASDREKRKNVKP